MSTAAALRLVSSTLPCSAIKRCCGTAWQQAQHGSRHSMLQPATGEGFVFGQECERADKEKLESLSVLPAAPVCAWRWCDTCMIHPTTLGMYISVLMACAGVTWLTTVMSACIPCHGSTETHSARATRPALTLHPLS